MVVKFLPIFFKVMWTDLRSPALMVLKVHMPWVPFCAEGRDGIHPPVKIDTEFAIQEPFRGFVFLECFPVRRIHS